MFLFFLTHTIQRAAQRYLGKHEEKKCEDHDTDDEHSKHNPEHAGSGSLVAIGSETTRRTGTIGSSHIAQTSLDV